MRFLPVAAFAQDIRFPVDLIDCKPIIHLTSSGFIFNFSIVDGPTCIKRHWCPEIWERVCQFIGIVTTEGDSVPRPLGRRASFG